MVDLSDARGIEQIVVVSTVEAKRGKDIIDDIVVEALASYFLEDASCQVLTEVAIVIAFSWCILVVRFDAVAVDSRIEVVECRIDFLITYTGCV